MNLFDRERRDEVLSFAARNRDLADGRLRFGDGFSERKGSSEAVQGEYNASTSGAGDLTGTDADDRIIGGRGDDVITGGAGNDYLIGGAGQDVINGGAGDDYIADGWGTGTMDGGDGIDTVDVSHTNYGAVIDLVAGTIDWNGSSPTETATNFENVIGSQGDDTIIGTNGDNILDGQAGDDRFIGGAGNDTLYGGAGRSSYVYNLGDGSDVIYNGAGSTSETFGDDGSHADQDWEGPRFGREGAVGKDHGQDSIVFGDGITAADVTITHVGADLILTLTDGETLTLKDYDTYPVETLEFADGSTKDISSYQPQNWTGRRKTWFTSGADNHYGGDGDDTLNGRSGHDQLHGGGGNDTLLGGSGNDGLFGGAGDDRIDGGSGRDTIYGDAGDDWISGGYGVDHMDGGAGNDTLDYAYSIENVDIDLAAGQSTFGSGDTEITTNFENAVGSQGDNVITGTSGANTIDGGAGDDVIKGGAGNDRLKGGSGADVFEFSKGDGIDIIDDFDPATDTLRISGAGNGSITIEYLTIGTLITYDRDGDGNPVDQVFLVGAESGLVTVDDIEQPDVAFVGDDEVDVFDGTDADESILTHGGDDVINAGDGNDFIQAGAGADEIHAGAGDDYVEGGLGADTIWLGSGNDTFVDEAESGPTGNDEVHGGDGDDRFYGAGGDDVFFGDAGSDELNGGAGNDTLVGGSGADLIELDFGDGIDTMTDFEDGLDIIDLSATGLGFADLTFTDAADGVHITYETDTGGAAIGELILTGITADVLSEDDFHFG